MTSESSLSIPRRWFGSVADAWDSFWFTPALPNTLGVLRILTGAMLLYGHLVLASQLANFLGDSAWINNDTARQLQDGAYGPATWSRTYLWHISSSALLWGHQILTIAITSAFMIGFLTRITGPAAWFLQLMYVHRLIGATFGFDQIVTYTTMYLMFSPCGSVYSVDAWLRNKFADKRANSRLLQWLLPDAAPSVSANIATRLLQLHLCVIYLFGGLAKARGASWWGGSAVWYSVANYEYQSMNMTWLGSYPKVFSAMSHLTMFWEIFYCALVWPKLTRPMILAIAVAVHGGIAMFLGMATFGLMMLAANMAFIDPAWMRRLLDRKQDIDKKQKLVDGASTSAKTSKELAAKEAKLRRVSKRLKAKSERLKERHQKIREREDRYRTRAKKLKSRETKVKAFIDKRRKAKPDKSNDSQDES